MTVEPAAEDLPVWFYALGAQRQGPVTTEELRRLAAAAVLNSQTLVWRDGMPGWLPAGATELGALAEFVPAPRPYIEGRTNPAARERWLKSGAEAAPEIFGRRYGLWLASYILGGIVFATGGLGLGFFGLAWIVALQAGADQSDARSLGFLSLAVVVSVAAISCLVFWVRMLLTCWRQVDDGCARTTPGLAVGLTLIPYFNAFWCFTSIYGLAAEMHRVMDENGIAGKRPSNALALTYSIVNACAILPLVSILAAPVMAILAPFLYHQLQRGARDIAAWRFAQSSGRRPGASAASVV